MNFRKIDLCEASSSTSGDDISVSPEENDLSNKRKCISQMNIEKSLKMKQSHFEKKILILKEARDDFVSALKEIQRSKEENAERRHIEKLAVKKRTNDLLEQLLNKLRGGSTK